MEYIYVLKDQQGNTKIFERDDGGSDSEVIMQQLQDTRGAELHIYRKVQTIGTLEPTRSSVGEKVTY